MRLDFTPRLLFAPQTAEEIAALNAQMEKLIDLYQKVDRVSYSQAQTMANAAKQANLVTEEIEKQEKLLHDTVFESDYLYRSFQETTAELKNQNNLLKLGKSVFNELTDVAQKLNSYQKGYTDLRDKDFKKLQSSFKIQKDETEKIVNDLGGQNLTNRERDIELLTDIRNSEQGLSKIQEQRLKTLLKEQELYSAALDAQASGIPILERELNLSKAIAKARQDIGGLAGAAAEVISKFGGSLSQYLDISDASEAVSEFNKKVIDDALKQKSVLDELNRIEQDRLNLSKAILDKQKESFDLKQQIEEVTRDIAQIETLQAEKTSLISSLNAQSVSDLKSRKNLVESILQSTDLDQAAQDNIKNKLQEQLNLQQRLETIAARRPGLAQELANISQVLANSQNLSADELNSLTARRNELLLDQVYLSNDQRAVQSNLTRIQGEVNTLLGQNSALQTKINDKLNTRITLEAQRNQLAADQDAAINEVKTREANLTKEQTKLDIEAYNVKQAAIKGASTGLTGFINKFKSLGVLINNLNFTKVFTDPVVLITTLIDLGFKANAQVVELGKSFNLSAKAAENIRQDVAEFARETGDTFITTNRLLQAQSELSKELGIAVRFSNEELATFAKLTELTGLSAQEAGRLALASKAAGMPTEAYTDSLREAAFFAQQATNTHFSSKEILQDISKLSAGILIKFQGNPKAMAQTVVEAKKLGLSLDQIDKVGESLLNWESSIENELKAELMTGKQLNLERARAAALSGDQLALTREISSQVGSLNDYQKMNVLAQKSLADAFGLSREEMAEMLMKQEAVNKYGKEAADLNKEQLEDMKRQGLSASEYLKKQEQQRTAQQKFQDALVKLQTIFANLVDGPVGQLLDAISDLSGAVVGILKIFSPIFTVVSSIAKVIIGAISGPIKFIADSVTMVTNGISASINWVLSGFKRIASAVTPFFSAIGSFLAPIIGFFSPIISFFSGAIGFVAKLAVGITALGLISGFAFSKLLTGLKSLTTYFSATTAATTAQTTATNVNTISTNTNTVASGRNRIATLASTIAQGAWNIVKGTGNLLMKTALGQWVAEKAAIITSTIAKWANAGATAAQSTANATLATTQTTVASTSAAASGGIASIGRAATASAGGMLAFGAAVLMIGGGIAIASLGLAQLVSSFKDLTGGQILGGIVSIAIVMGGFVATLYAMVPAITALGAVGTAVSVPLIALGAAFLLMGGGIALAAFGMSLLVKSMSVLPPIIDSVANGFVTIFKELAANWQILIPVGIGLMSIAGGLTLLGIAGVVSFPGLILAGIGLSALAGSVFLLSLSKDLVGEIAESIKKFGEINVGNLLLIGPALAGIGLGLAALGAGSVIEAIGSFLGGGPAEKLEELAATGDKLEKTSIALQAIGASISQLNSSLSALDVSKLLAIGPALFIIKTGLESLGGGGLSDIIASFVDGPVEKLERLAGIGDKLKTTSTALQTVSTSISQLTTSLAALDVSKLLVMGPALFIIKTALESLNGGGISDIISSFVGGPIEKLERLSSIGDKLKTTSTALQAVSTSISQLNLSLSTLDVNKLSAIRPALTGIGIGLASLGFASIIAFPGLLLGAIAIAALSAALIPFAVAANLVALAAPGLSTLFASLQSIDTTKLLVIGPALMGIGAGLASLGAGGVIAAIGSFLGGDPIEKLERLAASGDGLQKTATALQNLAGALNGVTTALNGIDASKLEALEDFEPGGPSIVEKIGSFITSPIETISKSINETTPGSAKSETINTGIDLTPLVAAINEVKASVDKLYTKETSINMDGKKVGTTLVQSSYKVA